SAGGRARRLQPHRARGRDQPVRRPRDRRRYLAKLPFRLCRTDGAEELGAGVSGAGTSDKAFDPRLIGGVIAIGLIAFVALWALIALGPQLKSGNDGKGHALSRGAPGFAAIVDLAERAGADVELRRRIERWRGGEWQPLLILTPTHEALPGEVAGLIDAQGEAPVLVVLPKWRTMPMLGEAPKPGWSGPAFPV